MTVSIGNEFMMVENLSLNDRIHSTVVGGDERLVDDRHGALVRPKRPRRLFCGQYVIHFLAVFLNVRIASG
jgi:hypothetical protein